MNRPALLGNVRKDAVAVLPRLAVLALMMFFTSAFAQEPLLNDNTPIVALACNVFNMLRGPAAFLIALIVVVVGGVAIAIGGKRVIGGVVWGIVGVGIVISATQIVNAIMPDNLTRLCGA